MTPLKGSKPAIGDELTLSIDRLAYHSGHGVSRFHGLVVFVPFTAPGDQVLARVEHLHSSYAEARLVKIIEPGPARRKPPCAVAGQCGGCQWQQVSYEEQLKQKQMLLREALLRIKTFQDLPLKEMIPAQKEFRYRNRIQIHRHQEQLGYYAQGSRQLVPIEDCLIAEEILIQNFPLLRQRAKTAPSPERIEVARTKTGIAQEVQIRTGQQSADMALFSQVNEAQNQNLIEMVLKAVAGRKFTQIFDLYCGSGNLTLPLAQQFPQTPTTGVELSREMIHMAEEEGQRQKARNITWINQSVGPFLRQTRQQGRTLVVLDPPRPGCDTATREALLKLRPEQIVYVSCNPTTLVRDLQFLLQKGAYTMESAQGLDMFPQTAHLEVLVSLIAPGL